MSNRLGHSSVVATDEPTQVLVDRAIKAVKAGDQQAGFGLPYRLPIAPTWKSSADCSINTS